MSLYFFRKSKKSVFFLQNFNEFLDSRPGEADRGDPTGDRGIGTIGEEIEIGIIAVTIDTISKFLIFNPSAGSGRYKCFFESF